jgi:hypothetical protein
MFPRELLGPQKMLGGGKYQRWKNSGDQSAAFVAKAGAANGRGTHVIF